MEENAPQALAVPVPAERFAYILAGGPYPCGVACSSTKDLNARGRETFIMLMR